MNENNADHYCIALQPIVDRAMRHVADELLYRSDRSAQSATINDPQVATARVCNIAFYETGVKSLVGSRRLFVNVPHDWLFKPELLPPYPEQMVIEVLEDVVGSPDTVAALHKIRTMGYQIALDDFILNAQTHPLLGVANIVKIDLGRPFDENSISQYKSRGIVMLAERVEDLDTFSRVSRLGFELFQGYFYAKPETQRLTSHRRTNNHTALLKLLIELRRDDVNYKELEDLITQDVQLTYLLLKYTNSALLPHRGNILTVSQAINALGLKHVFTVTMTILLANNGPASRILLSQALTRASMCETLATQDDRDVAFTAGLLSMMGVLLEKPLVELLTELQFPQKAVDAILLRRHPLGALLNAVEAFENANTRGWTPEKIALFNQAWLHSQINTTKTLSAIDTA